MEKLVNQDEGGDTQGTVVDDRCGVTVTMSMIVAGVGLAFMVYFFVYFGDHTLCFLAFC